MKRYTNFLLLSLILSSVSFTGRGQSESFEIVPETKTILTSTYARLVEDAVQRRELDTLTVIQKDRINELEQIQGLTEANLNRQITILQATNQALEIQTAALEGKYQVSEKQLRKKERGNKWLKIGIGAAFLAGLFAGR